MGLITGADPVTHKHLPTNLCGIHHGQHLYLSVKQSTGVQITINLANVHTQKWKVLVRQYDSSQTDLLAPRGCLQYHRDDMALLKCSIITCTASASPRKMITVMSPSHNTASTCLEHQELAVTPSPSVSMWFVALAWDSTHGTTPGLT